MTPIHISSFSNDGQGGNPAGVVIAEQLPPPDQMQAIAADLGYSETAFAAPHGEGWIVRYYAPAVEVAFCGHATIALGAALGAQEGASTFALSLRDDAITVEAMKDNGSWHAALQSPQTQSKPMPEALRDPLLGLLGWGLDDLNPDLPPTLASAGPLFGVLALKERATLAQMAYPFDEMKALMEAHDLVTINLQRAMSLPVAVS
jgi:PhzF family phenazine biosynthesis protein